MTTQLEAQLTQERRENEKLRAEVKRLERNTARLDWLAEPLNEFAFPVMDQKTGEWWVYHSDDQFTVSAPTLREAIDKAGKVVVA